MEIQGRECKEVKIGGHIYWFLEKYKGGDVRKVMELVVDKDMKIAQKLLVDKTPELFLILCKRIDAEILPTIAFLDNIDAKEYIQIQNSVIKGVDNLFTEVK